MQQRQPHRFDPVVQRLDLLSELPGGSLAGAFVLLEQNIAKRSAGGVEYHPDRVGLVIVEQFARHIADAIQGTGRNPETGGQRW
jgi:hypothetical protein